MPTYDYDQGDLDALGLKLAQVSEQFSEDERALLNALIGRGLVAFAEDAGEVIGFQAAGPNPNPASLVCRKAGGTQQDLTTGGTPGVGITLQCDGSVMPTDQFSLNFTKVGF